jgi:hypothetical protein
MVAKFMLFENTKINPETPCNFKNSLKLKVKILLFSTFHHQIFYKKSTINDEAKPQSIN